MQTPNAASLQAQKRGAWILAAGQTIVWAGLFYVFAALLFAWEQDLGWAKSQLAIGFTGALLVAAIVSPIGGRLIDAGLGRFSLTGGAMLGAVALAVLSRVQSPVQFVAVWAAIGVAQGACLYEPCFAFVTRNSGALARGFITRITLMAGFASFIAFPSGALLADAFGWRGAVMIFAMVVGLLGAPLLFVGASLMQQGVVQPATRDRKTLDGHALRLAFRNPVFWLLAVAFSLLAVNHGLLISHIVPLLVEKGLGQALAVSAASVVGPMQVVGRLVLFGVGSKASTMTIAIVCFCGVIFASVFLMLSGGGVVLIFAFAATQGASYGLVSIVKPLVIAEGLGRQAFGAISGWLAMPYLAGAAIGPLVGAVLWRIGGYDLAIAVAAALAFAGLICIVVLARLRRRAIAST